jgi:hypothetical protein
MVMEQHLTGDREEIKSLFDPQVEGIMVRVAEQLDWMSSNAPGFQVFSCPSTEVGAKSI